ncbi:MAG: deoxycytidylate deaminase [gamma proteobacterium symbiont of Ctena orbiculata]|nr:MAG: deoxycytidylate deaminase [gamma proteobacterium symbiont of Ctena orbiculata]
MINKSVELLNDYGYSVENIKLSDYIKKLNTIKQVVSADLSSLTKKDRYEKLQTAGNKLRNHYQNDILAELAISHIATHRYSKHLDSDSDASLDNVEPDRVAYIIDQLKHPDEVLLLRAIYGNLFYQIGVLCTYDQRKLKLMDEGLGQAEAEHVMERDQKEDFKYGQQLDRTLELSDLFVRNNHSNSATIERQVRRFLELVHGKQGITPTVDEYGMYAAYSAGLKSACLSRQVGASILDPDGNIISTGCNDVPKAGGGLYEECDNDNDQRCIHKEGGKCFNDHYKLKLKDELKTILKDHDLDTNSAKNVSNKLYMSTRVRDILEYSRSVHAEMDAITTVARNGGSALKGSYLYSTTFPCHNCARHIIASGIERVIYIEPYEKSLAIELHGDSIELEPDEATQKDSNKVIFLHFEGIAPNRYHQFFKALPNRKDAKGKLINITVREAPKVAPQYLDRYFDLESKVVAHISDVGIDAKKFTNSEK